MTQKISHDPIPIAFKQTQPLHPSTLRGKAEAAAGQFETLMALQMVRSMQSSLDDGNMFGGGVSGDIYNGLAEWQLAQTLAKGSHFGLKEQILKQLPDAEKEGT